jgi:hypothetical protein
MNHQSMSDKETLQQWNFEYIETVSEDRNSFWRATRRRVLLDVNYCPWLFVPLLFQLDRYFNQKITFLSVYNLNIIVYEFARHADCLFGIFIDISYSVVSKSIPSMSYFSFTLCYITLIQNGHLLFYRFGFPSDGLCLLPADGLCLH